MPIQSTTTIRSVRNYSSTRGTGQRGKKVLGYEFTSFGILGVDCQYRELFEALVGYPPPFQALPISWKLTRYFPDS